MNNTRINYLQSIAVVNFDKNKFKLFIIIGAFSREKQIIFKNELMFVLTNI